MIEQIALLQLPQYINSWRKDWEAMSLSLSGVHFGHYIVGTQHQDIAHLNWLLARVPLQMGYSLMQWQQGLNVLLEKSPGNYDMEWLCIILLFEADCNANNKLLGWELFRKWNWQMHWLANKMGVKILSMSSCNVSTRGYGMIIFGYRKSWWHCVPMTQKVVMIGLFC